MGEPRCPLMILCDGEFGGEVCRLSRVSDEMQTRWVEITATEAMTEMRWDLGSDIGCLWVSRWNLRAFWRDGAGNPAHTLKVT